MPPGRVEVARPAGLLALRPGELLAEALREHSRTAEVARERETGFGRRYVVEGELNTPIGRRPQLRTV